MRKLHSPLCETTATPSNFEGYGGLTLGAHLEYVETAGTDPKYNMPYAPAIKVRRGTTVWISGVTAAPIYHSHPHVEAEFDEIPTDPGEQAEMAFDNLEEILTAAGATLDDLVQLFRFMVEIDRNHDAINAVQARRVATLPTSTTVEVTRLATDPRLVLELTAVAVVDD